MEVLNRK